VTPPLPRKFEEAIRTTGRGFGQSIRKEPQLKHGDAC
jgi:hypothetical protein